MRPRLALAILYFTVPFIVNCGLIGATAKMMIRDENPLLIVGCITLSLCVTLIVIKAMFHLITEMAGPLETGPDRRRTGRYAMDQEESIPMTSRPMSSAMSLSERPFSPIPPSPPPPSPAPDMHMGRSMSYYDY